MRLTMYRENLHRRFASTVLEASFRKGAHKSVHLAVISCRVSSIIHSQNNFRRTFTYTCQHVKSATCVIDSNVCGDRAITNLRRYEECICRCGSAICVWVGIRVSERTALIIWIILFYSVKNLLHIH